MIEWRIRDSCWKNTHRSYFIKRKRLHFSCRSRLKCIKVGYISFIQLQPSILICNVAKSIWKRAKLRGHRIIRSLRNKRIRRCLQTRCYKCIFMAFITTVTKIFFESSFKRILFLQKWYKRLLQQSLVLEFNFKTKISKLKAERGITAKSMYDNLVKHHQTTIMAFYSQTFLCQNVEQIMLVSYLTLTGAL